MLTKYNLSFFLFCFCALGIISKNLSNPKNLLFTKIMPSFLLKVYHFSSYILKFDPFFFPEYSCLWLLVNICTHFFGCIHKNGITRTQGGCMFSYNLVKVFQSGCTNLSSDSQHMRALLLYPCQHLCLFHFNFSSNVY